MSYPESKTRRGRVQENGNISPTLTAQNQEIGVVEPIIGAIRGRNPENPKDRTVGVETEQMLEIKDDGTSNTLTTVQKDNVVVEPKYRIRKPTPRECWRLMDFDDEDFLRAKYGRDIHLDLYFKMERRVCDRKEWRVLWRDIRRQYVSDSQLYKQAGNSIVKAVLAAIFGRMI